MKIEFKKMTMRDLSLWHKWREVDHVKNTWFIEGYEPADYVVKKIEGNGFDYPFIILLNGEPIGFIQASDCYAYRTTHPAPKGVFTKEEKGTFCIDLFIADENYLGKGYGTKIVAAFVEKLYREFRAKKIVIDPSSSNTRAIRCYEKAGFRKTGTAYDGVCEVTIMEHTANKTA